MAIGDGVSAIAALAVTFGGFSPTAMDGVAATKEQIERVEAAHKKRRELEERRRAIERARASAPKRYTDDEGRIWTYVVMDESFVRMWNDYRIPRAIKKHIHHDSIHPSFSRHIDFRFNIYFST